MAKKKNNRNKRQRKIFLLLLLVVGTATMLGTATYAWFTANQNVAVDPINVNVEAANGIQISTDGTNWKPSITNGDITGADTTYDDAVNQLPPKIVPVSTAGIVDEYGRMEMFLGSVSASGNNWLLSTERDEEAHGVAGNFVAYDMFIKSDTTGMIYMTPDTHVIFSNAVDSGIKNSARVAFVKLGEESSDASVTDIQGINDGEASDVTIWEPNYDAHTSFGVAAARDTYGINTLTTGENNDLVPYDGVKAAFTTASSVLVGNANATSFSSLFGTVTPSIITKATNADYKNFMTINAGITKIRVYFWIEGQDVDCENHASGGAISLTIKLSTENA